MLQVLGCLDRPTSGKYVLNGHDVSSLDDDALSDVRLKYLGFVFQSFNLIPQLTVAENIALPLYYQGVGEAESAARARVFAEYVGLSSSRYSTLFSQYVSCNYKTYVDNLRIEKAKKLLEDGDMMIQEVAEAVGYDSAYSFSRLFKKKVGLSPNDYRLSFR